MIRGNRVRIDKFRLSDAYQMMEWKRAEDILMREYHFLTTRDGNVKAWYDARMKKKGMMSFAIKTYEGEVIGFISIRDISRIFKTSVLGITFDMNYIEKGYGTESLNLFLKYYFEKLGMKKMFLDVAKHNKRAISCYEKAGFELVRKYHRILEEEYYDIAIKELKSMQDQEFRNSFWIIGPFILMGYYKMKLSKKMYGSKVLDIC